MAGRNCDDPMMVEETMIVPMLSVIVPVYNEARTLPHVLIAVSAALPSVTKEIILVDDGSDDGTREWILANFPDGSYPDAVLQVGEDGNLVFIGSSADSQAQTSVRVIHHATNRGKGAALITGLAVATGQVIVIQDADLEYDPGDWAQMYELIAHRKVADVVYGSRFPGRPHRSLRFHHYAANRLISLLFSILYNQALRDVEVCYKMLSSEVKNTLALTCWDFGCEIEISAQIVRANRWRIYEVAIGYYGRAEDAGKKIRWTDGVKALFYLLKYRFV